MTGARAVGRRLWSWTLTALVILAGLGLQYGLAVLAESERESRWAAWPGLAQEGARKLWCMHVVYAWATRGGSLLSSQGGVASCVVLRHPVTPFLS